MATSISSPTHPPIALSQRWRWASQQAISYLMLQAAEHPHVLSLAAGLVDSGSLPGDPVRSATELLLADRSASQVALQYGSTSGSVRLRQALLEHHARLEGRPADELGVSLDQILLTTGSQQLLSLLCEVLIDPGDIVLVAAPTYFVFLGTLMGVGANIVSIPSDAAGMRTDALAETLAQLEATGELSRVKMIYVVSDFENPSGRSLSADRRREVVRLAREYSRTQRIFVLEDAAYRELRYDGAALPSIWSCDPDHQHVILAQTFSKSFSPGIRVGWGVVPDDLVGPLIDRKGNEDFGSSHYAQNLMAVALESGIYYEHVARLCALYRQKRDAVVAAVERYFGDLPGATWQIPEGGLYLWLRLPEAIDTNFPGQLFQRAARDERVMYVPGQLFYAGPEDQRPSHEMRLSFGLLDPSQLNEAINRLARAAKSVM